MKRSITVSVQPGEADRRLIITLPKSTGPGHPLPGYGVTVTDYDTGEQITSAASVVLRVSPREILTAELTMYVDEDGKPIANDAKPIVDESGENARTGVFRWMVTEIRTAS